jgi:aminocarboxymuconate-semialdehyde decarboxylase
VSVIDVHTHIVPEHFPAAPSPSCATRWPLMEHHPEHKASVMIGGKEFRLVDHRCWECARRLRDMDEGEITMQVVSPMPELLSYWLDLAAAEEMARHINGAIAGLIAAAPGRFAGLGMVPLQDPERAARALGAIKSEYGLAGVEIGSNVNGKPPGHESFDPFWAEAERLGLAIFVHALHPTATERMVGPAVLPTYLGFPVDTGLAAASLITGRTLEKFPKLRVGFSHGGGILAAILPRLANGWRTAPPLKVAFQDPHATARRFYYDNLVFEAPFVRYLMSVFGASQIFVGSDYPFGAGQPHPTRFTREIGLDPGDWEAMSGGNARRFLSL